MPRRDDDFIVDDSSEKRRHVDNVWVELARNYRKDRTLTTLLKECSQYEDSQQVTEEQILLSGYPVYLVTYLVRLYHRMLETSDPDEKLSLLRRISFYLNRGIPSGSVSSYVSNEASVDKLSRDFRAIQDSFPSIEEMPELTSEILTLLELEPYTVEHTDLLRKLLSLARSRGCELRRDIVTYPNEKVRNLLFRQFQMALYQNEEDREKSFNAIRYSLTLPVARKTLPDETRTALYKRTYQVLKEEVYGMEEAKAVFMSNLETLTGQKCCVALVGPPGVGKTSLLQALGKALNRPLYKVSVPGTDVSHLKGSARVYVGSGPGKIAEAFHTTGCLNPIILFDELDKMTDHENLSGVISELLDPTQNTFEDNHLAIPLDVSNVMFAMSMNSTADLEKYILDRILVVKVEAPSTDEKVHILQQFKLPRILAGLDLSVTVPKSVLHYIVRMSDNYSDAGLRKPLQILETVLKKLRLYRVIGLDHEMVPRELSKLAYPFKLTERVVSILWNQSDHTMYD